MNVQKNVLAINDISCIGRCSLTVILPVISACGVQCSVLPTTLLSAHGMYKGHTYDDLSGEIPKISEHFSDIGIKFDALFSGFLASSKQIALVSDIFTKHKKDGGIILVDPVMADGGKLYGMYTCDMVEGMKELCKKADIIVPNLTEATLLTDTEYKENYDMEYVEKIASNLADRYCDKVVITGVSKSKTELGAVCYDKKTGEIHHVFTERIGSDFPGTGDIFASVLLGSYLKGYTLNKSTENAVTFVSSAMKNTVQNGTEAKYGVNFETVLPDLVNYFAK